MPLSHWLTRRVTIDCAGKAWPIVFTHRVLLEIEAETGLDLLNGDLHPARPSAGSLRIILSSVLRSAGCAASGSEIDRLFGLKRLPQIRRALADAWIAAMPEPEKQSATPDGSGEAQRPTWTAAWAKAREDHGLSEREWLDLTPRMMAALRERRLANLRERELLASRQIAAIINFSMSAPNRPVREDAFMIHPWPEPEPKAVTGDDIRRALAGYRPTPKGTKKR